MRSEAQFAFSKNKKTRNFLTPALLLCFVVKKLLAKVPALKSMIPIVQKLPAALSWKARRRHLHQRRKLLRTFVF
jgi:hypothetical protein